MEPCVQIYIGKITDEFKNRTYSNVTYRIIAVTCIAFAIIRAFGYK